MSFNTIIGVCGGLPTGRYIGAGRDTSAPTDDRISVFICIIHLPKLGLCVCVRYVRAIVVENVLLQLISIT